MLLFNKLITNNCNKILDKITSELLAKQIGAVLVFMERVH